MLDRNVDKMQILELLSNVIGKPMMDDEEEDIIEDEG